MYTSLPGHIRKPLKAEMEKVMGKKKGKLKVGKKVKKKSYKGRKY